MSKVELFQITSCFKSEHAAPAPETLTGGDAGKRRRDDGGSVSAQTSLHWSEALCDGLTDYLTTALCINLIKKRKHSLAFPLRRRQSLSKLLHSQSTSVWRRRGISSPMKVGTLWYQPGLCLITFSLSAPLIYIVSPLIIQFITF